MAVPEPFRLRRVEKKEWMIALWLEKKNRYYCSVCLTTLNRAHKYSYTKCWVCGLGVHYACRICVQCEDEKEYGP